MMKIVSLVLILNVTLLYAGAIEPLHSINNLNRAKITLGKQLFSDTLLSKNNTISCASCHNLAEGGDDNLVFSFGINGAKGNINSPTVYNAVFNFRQFWNGRAKDLQDQASGPIENPAEMGNDFATLIVTLNKTSYKQKFEAIYAEGITQNSITDAIAEFEKTLVTLNSPFDRYLNGDKNAIDNDTKEGYELFKEKGCIACHHGINVGGNMYNTFGVMNDSKSKNLGRYEVTKRERDKYLFKVPSLRNVAQTAPYFHDGRQNNLKDAVKDMAYFQLGRLISDDEISKISSFLESLSGEVPKGILDETR